MQQLEIKKREESKRRLIDINKHGIRREVNLDSKENNSNYNKRFKKKTYAPIT